MNNPPLESSLVDTATTDSFIPSGTGASIFGQPTSSRENP
ncbi:sulfate adenylyltransferase small subunit, partial [Propionibacterium freudenreichii]|nr:sulfate adenylyltransferase small subunit [Propionibacterium freudenreichii]